MPVDYLLVGGNESARVTVLANVDAANVVVAIKLISDILTSSITAGVGAYLLFQIVGIAFLGPLFLALFSVSVPVMLGSKLARSHRNELEATEKRLRSTNQLVLNTRSVRVGGVQWFAADEVQSTRQLEVDAAALSRKIFIIVAAAGKLTLVMPEDHTSY